MYVDSDDGRLKVRVTKVRDGSFDWVSECGCYSATGFKKPLQDEKGKKITPVSEKSELQALRDEVTALKSQITK